MTTKRLKASVALGSLLVLHTHAIQAQDEKETGRLVIPPPSGIQEEVLVTGGRAALSTLAGSAAIVDEELIIKFETTDLNALLSQVPGVYIRQEDGFGLRPNIGLRGTSSERSSKITIMEDGILIGPAPYSAPAAYYVPNVGRMQAVEVIKGPSAIQHGPHSVGGAINFVSRDIPDAPTGEASLVLGSFGSQKARLFYGSDWRQGGYWLDAFVYGSEGFKEADYEGETGFDRQDFNGKFAWRSSESAAVYQEWVLKIGYAEEDANETYLGLSDADFYASPLRRYRASALDRFQSEHEQIQLLHSADFRNDWKVITRLYHHRYHRSWNKFDGIIDGPEVRTVLANPDIFYDEMALLRGERDSNILSSQRIDITNNDRHFLVSGIDSRIQTLWQSGDAEHHLELGLRVHRDEVERDHRQRGYLMQSGSLVFDGDETRPNKALNDGLTDAIAIYLRDEIHYGKWVFNLGFRHENIEADYRDLLIADEGAQRTQSSQNIFLPGAGASYKLNPHVTLLAGVYKGFSAKAVSAAEEVKPEESLNYEYGFRFSKDVSQLELIGFFSDYTNLIGRCRASDPCAGEEFNGGEIEVKGLEATASYYWQAKGGWRFPVNLVYTYSQAEFGSSFESSFDPWGDYVERGDELPYLPEHQWYLEAGLEKGPWSFYTALRSVSEMREVAGSGPYEDGAWLPELTTVDVSLEYAFSDALNFRAVVENASNEQEIVSRRPYGARPNQARTVKVGVHYHF